MCFPGGRNLSPDKRQGNLSLTASPVKPYQMVSPAAASTSCLPSTTDLQADLSGSIIVYQKLENPSVSTSTLATSNLTELSVTPELTPLKLPPVMLSPKGLPKPVNREFTTTTTTPGTQYQLEKQPSTYLPPVSTSPMQEEVCATPTATPRRTDSTTDLGLYSPVPDARHYSELTTTALRAQEQALPFHKGDFQSPFPNGDELVPEPLADSVKMEAGPLLSMIDLHQVECLYSKHWQLREKALQCLIDKLDANKLGDEPVPSFRYTFLRFFIAF